jgi:hypothetical protein
MIKVKFGDVTTTINDNQLDNYLSKGWQLLVEKNEIKPSLYDKYTDRQLDDIAKVHNMNFEDKTNRQNKIKMLMDLDAKKEVLKIPTNEGFTDGLILE